MKNPWLNKLHVYLLDDGEQWWYVASSEMDALKQHELQMDDPNDVSGIMIVRLSDNVPLGIYDEDTGQKIIQTCREWAAGGKGLIGSTVW